MGISFHRGPAGEFVRGSATRDFERWMEVVLGMEHLSEEAQCGGSLGRAPLLGTLKDLLRKALDTCISLHGGPFMSEGNLQSGGGAHILGILNDD